MFNVMFHGGRLQMTRISTSLLIFCVMAFAPVSSTAGPIRLAPAADSAAAANLVDVAKRRSGRNVCDKNLKYCLAQCKKPKSFNLFGREGCNSNCYTDHWYCTTWCSGSAAC
jgi:hypothetical protein